MNRGAKIFTCTVIWFQVISAVSYAQNYVLSPGDSIVATAPFDDLTVYNILQNNISTDTIWLSYEMITAEIPAGWSAISCDNVNCYTYLKESGDMYPVVVGDYGLMSMHITAHTNAGTALIRYAIWETMNPSQRDTLTWIISAPLTTIENYPETTECLLISENRLFIQIAKAGDQKLYMFSTDGKVCLYREIDKTATIDLSGLPTGIYLAEIIAKDYRFAKKFFLQ